MLGSLLYTGRDGPWAKLFNPPPGLATVIAFGTVDGYHNVHERLLKAYSKRYSNDYSYVPCAET